MEYKLSLLNKAYQFLVEQNDELTTKHDELQYNLDNVPINIDNFDLSTVVKSNQAIKGSYWDDNKNLYILYRSGLLIYGYNTVCSEHELYLSQGSYVYDEETSLLTINLADAKNVYSVNIEEDVLILTHLSGTESDQVWTRIKQPTGCVAEGDC
ncbi:MAG: hypothetical protein PHG99_06970 [Erysipelotrichaceae bacterium]|nr:hypothetical protein [Erysipelotrichaceae bacterium]